MNLLEILKNYWYVLVIAIMIIGVVIYYINYMAKTKPTKSAEKGTNNKSVVNEKESTNKETNLTNKAVVAKHDPAITNKTESVAKQNAKPQVKTVAKTSAVASKKTVLEKKEKTTNANVVKRESVTKPNSAKKESVFKPKTVKSSVSAHAPAKATSLEDVSKNANYRVVHEKETGTWAIKKSDATRVIRRVKTKEEAMEIVKGLSKNQGLNVVVHKRNGKFQSKK